MSDDLPTELVTVRLLGLPLRIHARAQEHGEAMRREFFLIVQQEKARPGSVPVRLLELSTALSSRYAGFTDAQEQEVESAVEAGAEKLAELTFRVPSDVAAAADMLEAILEEADDWCRDGGLLTLETPPDLVRYRHWYLENFRVQAGGGEPEPWTVVD